MDGHFKWFLGVNGSQTAFSFCEGFSCSFASGGLRSIEANAV
jgi:hypothetical protein